MPELPVHIPKGYDAFLRGLKLRIKDAQLRASLSVNRELIFLYWQIGRDILARQNEADWGGEGRRAARQRPACRLPRHERVFPHEFDVNAAFADAYPEESIVQQLVGQLPWGHSVILIDRVKNAAVRLWYARQTIQFGWSRNILAHQIETDLHGGRGKALTNFDKTLPAARSPHCPKHSEKICPRLKSLGRNCGSLKSGRRLGNESSGADRAGGLSRSHFFLETST